MGRLDDWLDDECQNMRAALMLDPGRDLKPADYSLNVTNDQATLDRLADFREAMRNSYRGQCLAAGDAFDDLWRTVPWFLRRPVEAWARVLRRIAR